MMFASCRFPTVTVGFVGNLSEPAELGPFSLFHAELGIVSAPKFQMFMEVLYVSTHVTKVSSHLNI